MPARPINLGFAIADAEDVALAYDGDRLMASFTDWTDRNTCVLFGDAAGAMVLGPGTDPERGIISTHLHTAGELTDILCMKGGGSMHPFSEEVLKAKPNYAPALLGLAQAASQDYESRAVELAEAAL